MMSAAAYPLSPMQAYCWRMTASRAYGADMNIALALFSPAGQSPEQVAAAVATTLEREAVLRTRIEGDESSLVQRYLPDIPLAVEIVRSEAVEPDSGDHGLSSWCSEHGIAATTSMLIRSISAQHKRYKFDWRSEFPVQATVVADPGGASVILMNFHHAVVDVHSLGVLAKQLDHVLNGREPAELVDLRFLVRAKQEYVRHRERARSQRDYWCRLMGSQPAHSVTSLLERPTLPCKALSLRLPVETQPAQGRAAQSHFLAAFAAALRATGLGGATHIISTTSNRRFDADIDLIGCCFRHVPWIMPVHGLTDPNELYLHFARQSVRSYQNLDVTLDEIIVAYKRLNGAIPAFNIGFSLRDLNAMDSAGGHRRLELLPMVADVLEERLTIHLHLSTLRGEMSALIVYDPAQVPDQAVEQLAERFVTEAGGRSQSWQGSVAVHHA